MRFNVCVCGEEGGGLNPPLLMKPQGPPWVYVLVHAFRRKLCIGSKKWRLVDSVDDLNFCNSVRAIQMPNFEVLGARIASALNRILQKIVTSKEGSVRRNKRSKKRTVYLVENRSLT